MRKTYLMATVYILFSDSINQFYIGSCKDLKIRLKQHKQNYFSFGFTKRAKDWKIYFQINNLEYQQARKIERHIKNMKSKTYIENLKKYSEISEKLILKYS